MRKSLFLVLIMGLVMALCMAGGASESDGTDGIYGTWYLVDLVMGDVTVASADTGMEMVITVNEDGSAVVDSDGKSVEGSWQMDGQSIIIEIDGEPAAFVFVDGVLRLEQEGIVMNFSKDPAAAQAAALSPVVENAELNDFIGLWNATVMELEGMKIPMIAAGQQLEMAIFEDKAVFASGTSTETEERALEFKDGTLSLMPADADGIVILLSLHEDGSISYSQEGVYIWFEKIEESQIVPLAEEATE